MDIQLNGKTSSAALYYGLAGRSFCPQMRIEKGKGNSAHRSSLRCLLGWDQTKGKKLPVSSFFAQCGMIG
jgi:hypothetical protein